jgi:FKBP-type peptidyl-prolyl cis-trans isomerase
MPPKKKTSTAKSSTVLDKIVVTIRALKTPGKGPSRSAIIKYLKSEFNYNNATALKKNFKQGVDKGILIQTAQSFRVASDGVVEESLNEDEILRIEDVKVGSSSSSSSTMHSGTATATTDGERAAKEGDAVTVSYVGRLENGYEFDKAQSFMFVLGAGDVIKGWDRGVKGMKVGGKRKLVVPSKLGYGKRGCKPDIPPNATLHFDIKLKKIDSSPE